MATQFKLERDVDGEVSFLLPEIRMTKLGCVMSADEELFFDLVQGNFYVIFRPDNSPSDFLVSYKSINPFVASITGTTFNEVDAIHNPPGFVTTNWPYDPAQAGKKRVYVRALGAINLGIIIGDRTNV